MLVWAVSTMAAEDIPSSNLHCSQDSGPMGVGLSWISVLKGASKSGTPSRDSSPVIASPAPVDLRGQSLIAPATPLVLKDANTQSGIFLCSWFINKENKIGKLKIKNGTSKSNDVTVNTQLYENPIAVETPLTPTPSNFKSSRTT